MNTDAEEQSPLLELEHQSLQVGPLMSPSMTEKGATAFRRIRAEVGLLLAPVGLLLLIGRALSTSDAHNLKESKSMSAAELNEEKRLVPYFGYNCWTNHGAMSSDCGFLQSTTLDICEAKCEECPGCVSFTVSSPGADGRVNCRTHSFSNLAQCEKNTDFTTYALVCGNFPCPDGFRKKPDSDFLAGDRPGLCCEEALCRCSQPGGSAFSCNQEALDKDCGEDRECAMDSTTTWRYFTDRYVVCKRRERLSASCAPMHTFYMYRASQEGETFVEGMNAANAVGTIGHISAQVLEVDLRQRNYMNFIRRLKVTVRATSLLQRRGMTFGPYYTYDNGRCGGAFYPYYVLGWNENVDHCGAGSQRYGSVIGCTKGAYGEKWKHALDDELIWYGIPAPCSQRRWWERDAECNKNYPGGMCNDTNIPTGAEDCTFSIEDAGTILLGELCGLPDMDSYIDFYEHGGDEWNATTDKGVNCSFWDDAFNADATRRRAAAMVTLFQERFGGEELEEAFCDYRFDRQDFCEEAILLDAASKQTALAAENGC